MPPDEPDSQHGISKRHRRCRSHSMTNQATVVDLTGEGGSSRKHGLHEKDPQIEGPSKRPKVKRDSEPPMRKDTTLAPKAKRKKSREKVNHHKASRTSNHHELKDRVKFLESVRDSVIEAHEDETQDLQADLDWHRTELKSLTQLYEEQTGEVREQQQMVKIERQDSQALKRKLEDAVNDFEACKLSCQDKDVDLKEKEKVIAVQRQQLDDSTRRSASLEKHLAETELRVKSKDEVIKALREELDDGKRQITSLEQSLAETKLALEAKNSTIDATQKELDGSKHQCASLKETLVETQDALNTAKRVQSDWRNRLVSSEDELSLTKRELDETKQNLERTARKADALHLINDENGHWNHKITQGEENAKDKLESERAGKSKLMFFERKLCDADLHVQRTKSMSRSSTKRSLSCGGGARSFRRIWRLRRTSETKRLVASNRSSMHPANAITTRSQTRKSRQISTTWSPRFGNSSTNTRGRSSMLQIRS